MLEHSPAVSTYSVNDVTEARRFYADTLGIRCSEEYGGMILVLHVEGHDVRLYAKPDHAPASFTVLDFPVDDIQRTATELGRRGVEFQRFDQFEMDDNGVHHAPGHDVAWFLDPAGNTLSLTQRT